MWTTSLLTTNHLLAELKEDIKTGQVKPLDEVINEP